MLQRLYPLRLVRFYRTFLWLTNTIFCNLSISLTSILSLIIFISSSLSSLLCAFCTFTTINFFRTVFSTTFLSFSGLIRFLKRLMRCVLWFSAEITPPFPSTYAFQPILSTWTPSSFATCSSMDLLLCHSMPWTLESLPCLFPVFSPLLQSFHYCLNLNYLPS